MSGIKGVTVGASDQGLPGEGRSAAGNPWVLYYDGAEAPTA